MRVVRALGELRPYHAHVRTQMAQRGANGSPARTRPIDHVWMLLPALLPALVSLQAKLSTIDLAYHIRLGEATLAAGVVIDVDTLTFSVPGTGWINQQWGAQVILAILFRGGGWATLGAVQALLIGLSFWLVARAAILRGATPRSAALMSVSGFLVAAPNLAMRPQLLALPLVAVMVWAIADRRRRPGLLWLAPLLSMVLANIHGSFPLIPLLLGLAAIEDRIEGQPGWRRVLAIGVASAATTLVNPYGPRAWVYVYELSTNQVVRDTIAEWAPVSLATFAGWLMVGSATLLAIGAARRDRPVPWGPILTSVVFFVMAMTSSRATLWWAVALPPIVAPLLRRNPANEGHENRGSPVPAYAILATLVVVVVAMLPWWRVEAYESTLRDAPPGITEAIRATLPEGSAVMMHQPWASWTELALPEVKVFVDSRIELYPEAVWLDYGQVAFAGARWAEVLDRWRPDAIVAATEWDLLAKLRRNPAWRISYEDEDGVLFVRV